MSVMRRINFKPIALFVGVAVLLSGCSGLNKMKKNADQINFKVTPEVLEAHASEVAVAIDTRFPAKYFNKKVTLTATPVLKYDGGETAYNPVSVQGESVEANNKVISYTGGSVNYKDAVAFDKAMAKSELYVNIKATQGAKSVDFEPIKVADGVIATAKK
jgi:PBP1b-binding outer membrane lipoprotein LpoB